jgi:hypothetical protein
MADEGFKSVEKIKSILEEYELWVSQSLDEFKRTTPEEDKVNERLSAIKSSKLGLKRQEAKYKMFKEYLWQKTTIEQAKEIIQKSFNLQVNANEESLTLDKLTEIIES